MTKLELVNIVNNISSSLNLNESFTDSQKCSMLIGTNVDLDKAEENGKIDHIYDLVMASKFASLYNAEMVMEEAMEEVKMVVEGVHSTKSAYALSKKYNIDMPIIEKVYSVLFEGETAKDGVLELMSRIPTEEISNMPWK